MLKLCLVGIILGLAGPVVAQVEPTPTHKVAPKHTPKKQPKKQPVKHHKSRVVLASTQEQKEPTLKDPLQERICVVLAYVLVGLFFLVCCPLMLLHTVRSVTGDLPPKSREQQQADEFIRAYNLNIPNETAIRWLVRDKK
jgi:hypothetical protein